MAKTGNWLLFALALFASPASAEKPLDLIGWNGIPWGVDQAEISSRLHRYPSWSYRTDGLNENEKLEVLTEDSFLYLGQEFGVLLLGFSNDQLVNVQLMTAAKDLAEEERLFRLVEEELVKQFGSPDHTQPDYLHWLFPSTTISLSTSALEGKPEPEVQLVFSPANSGRSGDQDVGR